MAPQVLAHPGARPIRSCLWTPESLAHPAAHPSTEDRDETVEAHYSGVEHLRPHACIDGWVFVGYVDEHGQEREASYACYRCSDSSLGQ